MAAINIQQDIELGETEHLIAGTIDFDSSYPTGGEALDPSGVTSITHMTIQPKSGYVFSWDATNQKVLAYTSNGAAPAALAEVPNTTSLATVTGVTFLALASS